MANKRTIQQVIAQARKDGHLRFASSAELEELLAAAELGASMVDQPAQPSVDVMFEAATRAEIQKIKLRLEHLTSRIEKLEYK